MASMGVALSGNVQISHNGIFITERVVFSNATPAVQAAKEESDSSWPCCFVYPVKREVESYQHVGVSQNRGTPEWMVYNGKPC